MAYEYKRRRPSIIRNFWVYRRLIGTAILLGLMLWFIWANDAQVTVAFPFGLGKLSQHDRRCHPPERPGRFVGDNPGHDRHLRPQAHSAHANIAGSAHTQDPPKPDRPACRPSPARLRRQNHRRVSQRSLVKLTKIEERETRPIIPVVMWRDTVLRLQPGAQSVAGRAGRHGDRARSSRSRLATRLRSSH